MKGLLIVFWTIVMVVVLLTAAFGGALLPFAVLMWPTCVCLINLAMPEKPKEQTDEPS